MDTDTICAAMLHDVVEDTDVTLDEVKKRFGQDVAMLVDGVTKLGKIPCSQKRSSRRKMSVRYCLRCRRTYGLSSSSCATVCTICAPCTSVPLTSREIPRLKL